MAEKKSEFDRRKAAFEKSYEADNWNEAIQLGEALRQDFPEQFQGDGNLIHRLASAYFYHGNAYLGKGEYDKAIADYTQAIKLNPYDEKAYNNRGNAYADKGEYDTAIADYNTAIELKPDYADAYFGRGTAYLGKGEYDKAIADYNTAIELNPNFAEAYVNRGTAYADKGEYDKAIADYNTAIELNPNFAEAYVNRGNAYADKGEYDRAIDDYTKAIEIDPDNATAYGNRGLAYAHKGEYDRAIDDYTKAIEIDPDDAKAYNNRGNAYVNKREYDRAIDDYDKAIEIDPKYVAAYHNRALAIGKKEAEETLKQYKEAISTVTEPEKIEERFDERKEEAIERLKSLRGSSDRLSCIIIFTLPLTWAILAYLLISYCTDGCDIDTFWSLPGAFASLTLATLFLHFPVLLRLSYLNQNARIERHVLEDYERKSVMLLLRNQEGENAAAVLKHYMDKGTPEVLNRLYHPKYDYPQIDETLIKRLATLITKSMKGSK